MNETIKNSLDKHTPTNAKHYYELMGKRKRETYANGGYNGKTNRRVWLTLWNNENWYKLNKWKIIFHFKLKFWGKK